MDKIAKLKDPREGLESKLKVVYSLCYDGRQYDSSKQSQYLGIVADHSGLDIKKVEKQYSKFKATFEKPVKTPEPKKEIYSDIDLTVMSDKDKDIIVELVQDGDIGVLHKHNKNGMISGIYDSNVVEYLKYTENIRFLGRIPYIYKSGVYKQDMEGTVIKSMIKGLIPSGRLKANIINQIYALIEMDDTLQVTYEDFNQFPYECIPFKNGLYDVRNNYLVEHAPEFMAINQLPCEFDPDKEPPHDKIDKWLDYICPAEDDKEMLLEYAGLCMTKDPRQQKFLLIKGMGGTGKSVLINFISGIVGKDNRSSLSLEALNERFMASLLIGKMLNSCADLETKAMDDVAMIKKIVGEDDILTDVKNKAPIIFKNYAKLLFSTNEMPIIKSERTNGFYRRLLVLEMNNKPEVEDPNLLEDLKRQQGGFIWLSVQALKRMYERGSILESENSKKIVAKHHYYSDNVEAFIQDNIEQKAGEKITSKELYREYTKYCTENGLTALGKHGFNRAVENKGYLYVNSRYFMDMAWAFREADESDVVPFVNRRA